MPQAAASAIYAFVGSVAAQLGASQATAAFVADAAVKVAAATAKLALLASANAIIANQNKPEQQGGMITLAINSNEPRRLLVGKRETGGLLADWHIRGTRNQNLYFIIYLGEGPCGELKQVKSGGRVVYDADTQGAFVHGVRKVIPDFRSGGDRLWVTYYDGRPGQTHDAYLAGLFPGVWTADHRGTGCAYVIVEMFWDSDNMTSPPNMSWVMEGAKIYDRRKDTTAGGSGAHRYNDPSTWELTTNPMVALDHYLLGRVTNGVKTFGIGLAAEDVPYTDFAAIANLCDETVATKAGGTQKRYEANGWLFADRTFKDTIKDLCRAMNARPADKGGNISVLDGHSRTPVMTLTDKDLIEGTADQYRPKQSWGELVSGAVGTYIDPRQSYQPVGYPEVLDPVWEAEDNGAPKFETIDFEMEIDQERAERLATLFVQMKRRQARLSGTYKMKAIQLEQGDWFTRTGGKFGPSGKVFEVIDRVLDPRTLTVTVSAFEVDPADSAWVAADAKDTAPVSDPDETPIPELGLPSVSITPVALSSGGLTFPAFRFENPDFASVVPYGVDIEYAFNDGMGAPTGERFSHFMPPGQEASTVYGLIPDTSYVVRARSTFGTSAGQWTAWSAVSTTLDYNAGSTGGDGALSFLDWVTLGSNVRLDDGLVTATNAMLLTSVGTASAIAGQGAFATLSSISSALANANNLLRYTAGGLFTGSLNADLTAANTAAAIVGQGPGATAAQDAVMNLYANYGVRKGFNFTTSIEGVTNSASATFTWVAGSAVFVTSATDQQFITTLNLAGRSIPKIRMRIRPTSVAFSWEGTVFYQTAGHAFSGSYRNTIPTPAGLAQNVWVIAEWDMTDLTVGGTDWVDNDIIAARFDITNGSGETWEIDWIAFGDFGHDPVGIRNIADNADPTASNTAAAIAGQGALATSGFVALGSTVRLSDGVTVATNALLLTSAGTAAAIAGQGALATISTVATSNVAANAISKVSAAYTTGTGGGTAVGDGWTRYQSLTVTTDGGPVIIAASGFATIGADTFGAQSVRVRRGVTAIYGGGQINQSYGADVSVPFSATIVDQPAAGTYTYYLEATFSGGDVSRNEWDYRALTATELKR